MPNPIHETKNKSKYTVYIVQNTFFLLMKLKKWFVSAMLCGHRTATCPFLRHSQWRQCIFSFFYASFTIELICVAIQYSNTIRTHSMKPYVFTLIKLLFFNRISFFKTLKKSNSHHMCRFETRSVARPIIVSWFSMQSTPLVSIDNVRPLVVTRFVNNPRRLGESIRADSLGTVLVL